MKGVSETSYIDCLDLDTKQCSGSGGPQQRDGAILCSSLALGHGVVTVGCVVM